MANASARVKILVSGTYARANLVDVVEAKKGQIVDICSAWYVDKMIALGNVRVATDDDVSEPEEDPIKESEDTFGEDGDDGEANLPPVIVARPRGRPPRNG